MPHLKPATTSTPSVTEKSMLPTRVKRRMPMKASELIDCSSSLAKEETALFNHRRNWNPPDSIDDKYLQLITPYDLPYHNPLRPLFSFQIKSLDSLNAFSHILLQDGVYFL